MPDSGPGNYLIAPHCKHQNSGKARPLLPLSSRNPDRVSSISLARAWDAFLSINHRTAAESSLLRKVIIAAEHIQKKALAETTGTDKSQVMRLIFQHGQIHGLVYIITVLSHHGRKIGQSVKHAFIASISYLLFEFKQLTDKDRCLK